MTDPADASASSTRRLAQRAVDALLTLCRRGNRLAAGVLFVVVLICTTGFLLGYAATEDATQILWIVVGGFFGIAAIGLVVAALLALRRVTHAASELFVEVQALLDGNVVTERTVFETVEAADAADGESALVLSRQFSGLQSEVVRSGREFPAVLQAMKATVRLPAYLGLAILISFVFAVLSPLFLLSIVL